MGRGNRTIPYSRTLRRAALTAPIGAAPAFAFISAGVIEAGVGFDFEGSILGFKRITYCFVFRTYTRRASFDSSISFASRRQSIREKDPSSFRSRIVILYTGEAFRRWTFPYP